ncbi:MAG: methyltransferase domain-containing protein [Caldilineaceae bacterium]|nr:methyltransferase domain-containing protein [Caldilineaceae bacterium]
MQKITSADAKTAEKEPTLRLLLICHAEAMQIQAAQRASIDTGLSAQGWQQTDILANWLMERYAIDELVTAPELRNRLTAQRIGQAIGLPVTIRRDWGGKPFGANINADEATLALPHVLQHGVQTTVSDAAEKQEREFEEYCHDLRDVFTTLSEVHSGETIAVVMNEDLISASIACLTGGGRFVVRAEPTSIAELRLQNGHWTVLSINRHEHLPTPPGRKTPGKPRPLALAEEMDAGLTDLVNTYNQAAARLDPHAEQDKRKKRFQDLIAFADIPANSSVLDAGAGTGELAIILAQEKMQEVIGIDISPTMLEHAELRRHAAQPQVARRLYFRLAAAHALPFRNERFDAVIVRLMLHHLRNPEKVMTELARVLRPGGIFVLADLLSNPDPVKRATQNAIEERRNPAYYAARSEEEYRTLLADAGLRVASEKVVTFERELDEWLNELPQDGANKAKVQEMMKAGVQTDAAGLNVHQHGDVITFEQRLFYCRAVKE